MNASAVSPVPPAVQSLIELFQEELAEVKFPDVDGERLESAARQLTEDAERVAQAEAALERAREQFQASHEALLHKGSRALAYARVYAEERPPLAAKLDVLSMPLRPRNGLATATELAAPRRRGRPPKTASGTPGLFVEGGAPESTAEESAAA